MKVQIHVFWPAMVLAATGCADHEVANAKARVAAELKDPASARFQNIVVAKDGTVCGEIDGRNAHGARAGFRRFVAIGQTVLMEPDAGSLEAVAVFDPEWKSCHAERV